MNKVVSNHKISPLLIDLIKNSQKYVILISPFLDLWELLFKEIELSIKRGVKVKLIYRSGKINPEEMKIENPPQDLYPLQEIGVEIFHIDDLHTKLYLSEKESIITSMNLWDYSRTTNEELGLYTDDKDIQKQLNKYCKELFSHSHPLGELSTYQQHVMDEYEKINPIPFPKKGHCIRCNEEWEFDIEKKYCYDHWVNWKKFNNPKYIEKYCNSCGEEFPTSFDKPYCKDCVYEYFS